MSKPVRSTAKMLHRAATLRAEPTPAESILWRRLRASRLDGVKFRRQHAIGRYVVDFCAPGSWLIIELDGSQHLKSEGHDLLRTRFLESEGYRVLRFWNDDVANNIDGVMRAIQGALKEGLTRPLATLSK